MSRPNESFACKVCGNSPNDDGYLTHGKGCFVVDEHGGGEEYIQEADRVLEAETRREKALEVAMILDKSAGLGLLCDIEEIDGDLVFRFGDGSVSIRSINGANNAKWWLDGFDHASKLWADAEGIHADAATNLQPTKENEDSE